MEQIKGTYCPVCGKFTPLPLSMSEKLKDDFAKDATFTCQVCTEKRKQEMNKRLGNVEPAGCHSPPDELSNLIGGDKGLVYLRRQNSSGQRVIKKELPE